MYTFLKPKALRDLLLIKSDGDNFARASATISLICFLFFMFSHALSLLALYSLLLHSLSEFHTSSIHV